MKDVEPKESVNKVSDAINIVEPNGNNSVNGSQEESHDLSDEKSEITLTDHLNKKLLSSFLDRINQNPSMFPSASQANSETNDFEEEAS